MRQQEVNLFNEGLNLDNNPIAMSNHLLTDALNATMITMNGNELVLQNDMGNGRVDQAQLPEGYVPVGMLEYGGIVYVASYNPIKGESLIGCFPSPLRNIPSSPLDGDNPTISNFDGVDFFDIPEDETPNLNNELTNEIGNEAIEVINIGGNSGTLRNSKNCHLIKIKVQKPLINSILRPGDKFLIKAADFDNTDAAIGNHYLSVKVVTVDSENNSIDITDLLTTYLDNTFTNFKKFLTPNVTDHYDNYYNIYKNKIAGKLYIQEELIVPSYINVGVSAEVDDLDDTKVNVTLSTNAYDSDGNIWITNAGLLYDVVVKNGNGATINLSSGSYLFNKTDQMVYEVTPYYMYDGTNRYYIDTLKRTGSYDVSSIGSGKVEFNGNFKYFNDIARNSIVIDYNIQAYVENSEWLLTEFYLETYDVEDLFTNVNDSSTGYTFDNSVFSNAGNSDKKKIIKLDVSNYFGSYSIRLDYKAANNYFNIGYYYIARLVAKTRKQNNGAVVEKEFKSDLWYAIITSSITNKDYVNKEVTSMYPLITNDNAKVFELSWMTDFSEEMIDNYNYDTHIGEGSNVMTRLPDTETPSTYVAGYSTARKHILKYRYSANTTVNVVQNFPFKPIFNPNINIDIPKCSTSNITYVGNQNIVSPNDLITPINNGDCYYVRQLSGTTTKDLEIELYSFSKLYFKLRENPTRSNLEINDWDRYRFYYEDTVEAFVPYAPQYYSEENKQTLRRLFGSLYIDANTQNAPINDIQNRYWLCYFIDRLEWNDVPTGGGTEARYLRWRENAKQSAGYFKDVSPDVDYTSIINNVYTGGNTVQWTAIFDDNYRALTSPEPWSSVQSTLKSGLGSPLFAFWHSIGNQESSIVHDSNINGWGHLSYAMFMMLDLFGDYHVMNQIDEHYELRTINRLLKAFSKIYLPQTNQHVAINYYLGSNEDDKYVYNNKYNTTITTSVSTYSAEGNLNVTKSGLILNLEGNTVSNFNNFNRNEDDGGVIHVNDKYYKFPTFKLVAKNSDESKHEYTYELESPDLSSMNARLLADGNEPQFGGFAIIKDTHGNTTITTAYKLNSNGVPSTTIFDNTHQYVLCELPQNPEEAILVDILESDINAIGNTPLGKYAKNIAQYLKDGSLIVRSLIGNSVYKAIYVQPSKASSISSNNNHYYLGEDYNSPHAGHICARINMSDLASVKDLKLINESISENSGLVHFN